MPFECLVSGQRIINIRLFFHKLFNNIYRRAVKVKTNRKNLIGSDLMLLNRLFLICRAIGTPTQTRWWKDRQFEKKRIAWAFGRSPAETDLWKVTEYHKPLCKARHSGPWSCGDYEEAGTWPADELDYGKNVPPLRNWWSYLSAA